jgi:hypothetical protein
MLLELPGGRRDRLLFICQAAVPALIILITTVSCAGPGADMPPPNIVELFTGGVTEAPNQKLVQQDEAQPKARRGQPKASTSPKVASEQASKATSQSASRPASKKASTDAQKEQQLYQEFLEWRKNQREQQ